IAMDGAITRFVRLQSSSKAPLMVQEVEVYPPVIEKEENPLNFLALSESATEDILKQILQKLYKFTDPSCEFLYRRHCKTPAQGE
ncbi:MAG: hypothetical protein JSV96_14590, partial [Candidatus Aminicenantes bacterium]